MQVSEQWLREWVNPAIDSAALAAQLTMAGLEVDAVEPVAKPFNGVVIAQVLATEPHPQADRLRVCRVNDGQQELSIVCGAANVRAGLKVALAIEGARLPGLDHPITETKMRGVLSQGMLCAAAELGLAESSEGLLELDESAPVGVALWDWLNLNDQSIELGLTPNRGDCLSVMGLAREIAALNQQAIATPVMQPVAAIHDRIFPVAIQASKHCPCYVGRVIEGIRTDAVTPIWMVEKLRRSGVRSIHPVVDVTNYVMLELGQPMHAFDLNKLKEGIQVRLATSGECITLLDGQTLEIKANTLVISDGNGPIALAGIMGGEASKVDTQSQAIFLESAFFDPIALAGQARRYGLHTDASHRFERGVDFTIQRQALERATELLLTIVGGIPGPVIEIRDEAQLPKRLPIELTLSQVQRLLGFELSASVVMDLLVRLEMHFVACASKTIWQVTPPSYRFDISESVDLVEELARLYGYNQIPSHVPSLPYNASVLPLETQTELLHIKQVLVDRDYQEVITYSFVDPQLQQSLYPEQSGLALANPISADLSVMRLGLWPGLIQTAQYNLNRQQNRVRIFESGLVFLPTIQGDLQQVLHLGGLITGPRTAKHWCDGQRSVDFFDLKGDLETVIKNFLPGANLRWAACEHAALQPGQTAHIYLDEEAIGWMGALHPKLQNHLDLASKIYVFEICLSALSQTQLPCVKPLSKFPGVQRDIALVVDSLVSAQSLIDAIQAQSYELIQEVSLFDVYEGDRMDIGKKSVALNLTIQHPSHTLKDSEVNECIDKVITCLKERFDVILRE